MLQAARAIASGQVVAVKGTGGFLLAVDAADGEAVERLRARKHRPHKPFAVMVRDLAWAEEVAAVGPRDREWLQAPERPILLLPKRRSRIAEAVAPHLSDIGIFLPSNGLQVLLLREGPPLQVMTSGNFSGAPIAREDPDGRRMLGVLADGVLLHDREIRSAADDSVFRGSSSGPIPIRRSRGFVPLPIPLPFSSPPVLALGGNEKNTICLASGKEAFLSQHLGDPDEPIAWERLLEAVERLQRFTGIRPRAVAHDLHPDFRTTRWAIQSGLPCIPVQHHHAHVAGCLAEHGVVDETALGVAFDGTGLGSDGALWGGEFLLAGFGIFRRLAHLPPLPLAGGEAAIREPWRVGLAALRYAGEQADLLRPIEPSRLRGVQALLDDEAAHPLSTGAGRWFDAVAALCGFSGRISYEGQAAAQLESLASDLPVDPYPFDLEEESVDLRPTVRAIARELRAGVGLPLVAARFHETVARIIEGFCLVFRRLHGPSTVALSGGAFQNRLLLERTTELLESHAFRVLSPKSVPPNDGGLSFGQAAVAGQELLIHRNLYEAGSADVSRDTG